MSYDQPIRDAIAQQRLLAIRYGARDRVVEPHCYGLNTRNEAVLRAYQIEDETSGFDRGGWRLFSCEKIETLAVLPRAFMPRVEYRPDDRAIEIFLARL